jgi:glyoxylase-like metal-dependent hydrolase (beta-lactamase superfamily II)
VLRPRVLSPSIASFPARTPTLPPATHTNSYALGAREVLLVEPATPYDDEQREWLAWVRGLASGGRVPIAIALTHHHLDHVGGLDVLSRELGLPLWAHAETAARVRAPVVRRLGDGDVIDLAGPRPERWRVLHTPGHAPGHVCFHDEESGALVAGDMVASQGTILIAPGDGDMKVYLEQLERLARLDTNLALPAHGDPIERPSALFRQYIAHRLMREDKVLAAVSKLAGRGAPGPARSKSADPNENEGPARSKSADPNENEAVSLGDLLPLVYEDVPAASWPLALLSLQAHLEKLEREGRILAREPARYSAVE